MDRKRFTLRIPTNLYEALSLEANQLGITLNGLISQILWEWNSDAGHGEGRKKGGGVDESKTKN